MTLCFVGDSDLAGIYVDSNQVEANPVEMNLLSLQSTATGNRKLVYYCLRNHFLCPWKLMSVVPTHITHIFVGQIWDLLLSPSKQTSQNEFES